MFAAPAGPTIIPEECSAENNSVTVAWQPPPTSYVEGYVLELDDGCGGDFRVSYNYVLRILYFTSFLSTLTLNYYFNFLVYGVPHFELNNLFKNHTSLIIKQN